MAENEKAAGDTVTRPVKPAVARSLVERIEEIRAQKDELSEKEADIKQEASEAGIKTEVLNEVLKQRKRIRKSGQLEFNEFLDGVSQFNDALAESGIAPPFAQPETGASEDAGLVH